MFINSKINLLVRNGDDKYIIPKDFIGEIPNKIAKTWLVQQAIKSGHIVTPDGKTDKALEKADKTAEEANKAGKDETLEADEAVTNEPAMIEEEPRDSKKAK